MSQTALSSTINFSDEQSMLLDTAVEFCRDNSPVAYVRNQMLTESGFEESLWEEMVNLGWLGLAIPEAYGGSELGLQTAVVISEPMGRALLQTPFQSTQLAIQGILQGSEAQKSALLPRIAQGGKATVALFETSGNWDLCALTATAELNGETVRLSGTKTQVIDAAVADIVVVSAVCEGVPALAIVERGEIPAGAFTRETVLDETRRSYLMQLDGISVPATALIRGSDAIAALDNIRNAALLLIAAESCGGIAGVLDVVVEYLNTRTQFGRKIGAYQGLKHPTADILVGLERSRSHVYHAASVLDSAEAEAALRMAKAQTAEAFAFAGDRAIQFHGGFGFTYECDAQLYLRRAMWSQYAYGDAMHHRKKLAELLL